MPASSLITWTAKIDEGHQGVGHDQPRQRVASMSYLTASRKPFPALNLGVLLAGMKISRPVWGLRPLRAARDMTENVPKPTSVTLSPLLKASWTLSTSAFRAFSASRLVISASLAIRVTKSALFIAASLSFATVPPMTTPRAREAAHGRGVPTGCYTTLADAFTGPRSAGCRRSWEIYMLGDRWIVNHFFAKKSAMKRWYLGVSVLYQGPPLPWVP